MGITRIIADIDRNVVHGQYIRTILPGEDLTPVDLTVKLIHQYITQQNTVKEIDLNEVVIPGEFLTNSSGLPGTDEIEQTSLINFSNPRYLKDLFLEISEVRDTAPVITRVPVLDGLDNEFPSTLPEQPFKDPEHETNIPPTLPEKNISTPELVPVIYTLADDDTSLIQASRRIYLTEDENSDDLFKAQEFNQRVDVLYIENAITNFLPNPQFEAGSGTPNTPDKYEVDAPGLIATFKLESGDIEDTFAWTLRVANTNPFNAFDTATIKTSEKSTLLPGLNALTGSVYYTINSDFKDTPFTDFNLKFNFYNSDGDLISTEAKSFPVGPEGLDWQLMYATVQGSEIPLTAVEFDFEIETPGIDSTDPFQLKLYLPQVESSPYFTTRTLIDRVQDTYETTRDVELKPPVYFLAKSYHVVGPGTRGLVSTTTQLKDGFHFLASSDRLRLKAFDVNGLCIFNVGSAAFTVTEGEATEYGVYIDGSVIEFFLNGVLLSSHTQAYALSQTVKPLMGSLESSNTRINSELLDWKILRTKP